MYFCTLTHMMVRPFLPQLSLAETPLPVSDLPVFRKPNKVTTGGYPLRLSRDRKCKFFPSKAKSLHFPLTGANQCHTIGFDTSNSSVA